METDGANGENDLGKTAHGFGAVCSSEPVPSCLTSSLLIVSVTITSVLLLKHKSQTHIWPH